MLRSDLIAGLLTVFLLALIWTVPFEPDHSWGWDESMHAALPAAKILTELEAGEPVDALRVVVLDCQQYPFAYPAFLALVQGVFGFSETVARLASRLLFCVGLFGLFLLAGEVVRTLRTRRGFEAERSATRIAFGALAFGALCPLAFAYSGTLFQEVPFLAAEVYLLTRLVAAHAFRKHGSNSSGSDGGRVAGDLLFHEIQLRLLARGRIGARPDRASVERKANRDARALLRAGGANGGSIRTRANVVVCAAASGRAGTRSSTSRDLRGIHGRQSRIRRASLVATNSPLERSLRTDRAVRFASRAGCRPFARAIGQHRCTPALDCSASNGAANCGASVPSRSISNSSGTFDLGSGGDWARWICTVSREANSIATGALGARNSCARGLSRQSRARFALHGEASWAVE